MNLVLDLFGPGTLCCVCANLVLCLCESGASCSVKYGSEILCFVYMDLELDYVTLVLDLHEPGTLCCVYMRLMLCLWESGALCSEGVTSRQ